MPLASLVNAALTSLRDIYHGALRHWEDRARRTTIDDKNGFLPQAGDFTRDCIHEFH